MSLPSKSSESEKEKYQKAFLESIKYQIFHQDVQNFKSIEIQGLKQGELTYIYMPASAYGIGAALFRNSSFEKTIEVAFIGKQLGKAAESNL